MAITFAPNGIYLGMLAGLVAGVVTQNLAVGVVVAIAGSVVAWYGIRAAEKLLGRGVDAGFTAVMNRVNRSKPAQQRHYPPQFRPQPSQQQYPPGIQWPQGQQEPPRQQQQRWG